ncbi:MerR family transcriptional regulator [Bacillus sp. HMF5848]|uniref:MerR family transcriptional regulator n=1 Tax=Bacillus sp. HMF5848 TaxID=2495421 RepID=UPI000F768E38|nr:MerR family transcriptional regulator [Bacillus sp. HMF5848]RSK25840.1 MerR family transcriptional regulator [Bacillus sp. HMF5848]
MYQIGLFSKMNRITTKTLRYYDEIGILKPECIDDFTGYRYYSSSQLARLNTIISLKQMGFSLGDIKELVDNESMMEEILLKKENELCDMIKDANEQLLKIKSCIKAIKGGSSMKYNPVIKSLPEVIVASMRFIAKSYDEYFDVIPKMGEEMVKAGAVCASPEYCFNVYHDQEYKDKDIDVEVCEAVVDYCQDTDMVKYKKINKVEQALCVVHKGSYHTLRDAYNFAFEWMKDNGYNLVGEPRERYIDGIWNKENEEDWLTELQIPISTK